MSHHEAYLRSAMSKYKYVDIAKRDILNAFQNFKDLRPKLDHFVFNDGSRKELLCLEGTIPVNFKGSTYNIPVCLWIIDTHPYNPPMVFVKPTSTMQIKPGRHVDTNGRIYLPYLHEWKHPQSDLLGLIQILTIVFGEEPPVYAKSAGAYPAYPGGANPPYPAASAGRMPMPGYPPSTAAGYPPANPSGQYSYPNYSGYPPQQQAATAQGSYGSQTGYPAYSTYSPQQTSTPVTSSASHGTSLSDEQIKASLLSAVEDKMRRRLTEIFAQSQAELDALKRTQMDLQKGKQTLEDMLQRLEREQSDVERNAMVLKEKNEELVGILGRLESQEQVDIDDAVTPTAPLYKQLFQVFAEEQAIGDAIYYLGEGMRKGVIDIDVFLKQVRELSRKQFMQQALMRKCRQKAGLADVSTGL